MDSVGDAVGTGPSLQPASQRPLPGEKQVQGLAANTNKTGESVKEQVWSPRGNQPANASNHKRSIGYVRCSTAILLGGGGADGGQGYDAIWDRSKEAVRPRAPEAGPIGVVRHERDCISLAQ